MAKWPIVGYDGTQQLNGVNDRFAAFGGDLQDNSTEANVQQEVRDTYTASNLRLYLSSWVGGAGVDDMIATSRVNGAAGNQTITINATGEHEDTSNTDSLVSGDLINVHFDHSAGGHSDEYTVQTFQTTLDASSDVPPIMNGGVWSLAAAAEYGALQGVADRTTESDIEYTMRASRTLRDLRVYATAHSSNLAVTMRKNQADGNLTVSVTGTGEFLDTSNTDSFVAGDEADYGTDTGTATLSIRSVEANTSSGVQMWTSIVTGSGTLFLAPSSNTSSSQSTEARVQIEAEDAATIQNLFVNCFTYAETRTIRTRKNAANGNASVSVTGTGIFEDTSNTDTLVAEDDLSVQQDAGSSGANGYLVAVEWDTAGAPTANISAVVATADAAALLPTITSVVIASTSVTAVVATADAAALLPAVQIGTSIAGVVATADAAAVLPTITTVEIVSVSGVVAEAPAAALLPAITSVEITSITAVVATADAAVVLPAIEIGTTITAVVATADAAALLPTITAEGGDVTVTAVVATATADALLPTITSLEIVSTTVSAVVATTDAAVVLPAIQIATSIASVLATADAAAVLPTITSTEIVSVGGVVATADAAALLPTVTTVQIVSVSSVIATADADALPPTVTSVGIVAITGVVATADAAAVVPTITNVRTALIAAVLATSTAAGVLPTVTALVIASTTINAVVATATASVRIPSIFFAVVYLITPPDALPTYTITPPTPSTDVYDYDEHGVQQ